MQFVDWVIKTTGKISDNFNQYRFYVKHEPQFIDSSSTLSLTTYVSRDQTATVPCNFKWFKIRNGLATEVPQFRGNTYMCEPSDVGSLLQVQITSNDPQHNGTAILKYGPVMFDVLLKKQIQIALSCGQATYQIDLIQKKEQRECQLKITDDKIYIRHLNSDISYIFGYSMIEPRIQTLTKSPTKMNIIFNQKYHEELRKFLIHLFGREILQEQLLKNPFIELNFSNRKSKDSFIFVSKAFNTKRQMKTSSVINKIEKVDVSDKDTFDYVYQIQSLRKDVFKLLEISSRSAMDKRVYINQNKKLQKEIQQIITSYTRIIQQKFKNKPDFQKSFAVLTDKKHDLQLAKIQRLEQENQHLKQKLNLKGKNQIKEQHTPFTKKKGPYIQQNLQTILNNLNDSFRQDNENRQQKFKQNKQLTKQLNQSFQRINQLQTKVKEYERKSEQHNMTSINFTYGNKKGQTNLQTPTKTNQTALDHSLILLSKEKDHIQKKYAKLKKQYQKIKTIKDSPFNDIQVKSTKSKKLDDSSLLLSKDSENPEILKVRQEKQTYIKLLQTQNSNLKAQISGLSQKIQQKQVEKTVMESKYKRKINDLSAQLEIYRRSSDALNRSQHLSMQMQLYNQEQMKALQNENEILRTENDTLQQLCQRYLGDAKKYKNIKKQIQERNIFLESIKQK